MSGEAILALFPVVGLGLFVLWQQSKRHAIALGLWALVAFIIVVAQNRFFKYHCVLFCSPLTILGAVGFHKLFFPTPVEPGEGKTAAFQPAQILGALLLGVVIFQTAIHPLFEVARWTAYLLQPGSRAEYYAGFGEIPVNGIQAAEYIRERTTEDECIYVWGWDAMIYYLSGRQSCTRFGYSLPLVMGAGSPIQSAYRQEFLAHLAESPPAYIVIGPQSELILGRECGLCDFPEFADFVSAHYLEETRFGDLILYRLETG